MGVVNMGLGIAESLESWGSREDREARIGDDLRGLQKHLERVHPI